MIQKMRKTTAQEVIMQLKNWFMEFCNDFCTRLNLTAPYPPQRSGAAERGVGMVKAIMKRTELENTNF